MTRLTQWLGQVLGSSNMPGEIRVTKPRPSEIDASKITRRLRVDGLEEGTVLALRGKPGRTFAFKGMRGDKVHVVDKRGGAHFFTREELVRAPQQPQPAA